MSCILIEWKFQNRFRILPNFLGGLNVLLSVASILFLITPVRAADSGPIVTIADEMPQYSGGQKELYRLIYQNLAYPAKALSKKLEGQVVVGFVVETDGSIGKVRVIDSNNIVFEEEALRLVRMMPRWIPGFSQGSLVRVQMVQTIYFSLNEAQRMTLYGEDGDFDEESLKQSSDRIAEFPGGAVALNKYLADNLNSRIVDQRSNIAGLVVVTFCVRRSGKIDLIRTARSLSLACDVEAMRVVGMMPQWRPAEKDGDTIPCRFTLPVRMNIIGNDAIMRVM